MELSPRQRRAVFAVIVIALAALGYYLVVPAVTHSRAPTQAAAPPTLAGPAAATTPPQARPRRHRRLRQAP